ncbi:MAG TPA: DUF6338 family protein [Gammaproteobacteria bacterium]|nr:DUF6338 family protein [Gammaproteobacteria bacterium]
MELTKDVIATLEYLLPGFLAAWVFYGLTSFPKPSEFERVVQALIFTLIVQAATLTLKLLLTWIGYHWSLGAWTPYTELVWTMVIAFAIGVLFSYCSNGDKFHGVLRKVRLTKVTSYPSEWTGVFSEKETSHVVIHMSDERRLFGWPKVWPSDPKKGHLLIEDPYWLDERGTPRRLKGVDSILVDVRDVKWVEFFASNTEVDHGH